VPLLVKQQIEGRGSELLGRQVRVGEVAFAPWTLSLTLHGLTVGAAAREGDSAPPQLQLARLHASVDARSLLRLAPVIDALEVDAPRLRLARTAPGHYDIDDILARLAKPPEKDDPPVDGARFAVFNIQLRDGELHFEDRPLAQQHRVHALQLALPFVSSLPDDVQVRVEPRLAFLLDGTAVDLQGHTLPFAADRASELTLRMADLPLARRWGYLPVSVPLRPEGGVLTADLKLRFSQPKGQAPHASLSGKVTLRDLGLRNTSGAPMLAWKRLGIELRDVRPLAQVVELGRIEFEGAQLDVRRDAQGRIEWTALGDVAEASRSEPPKGASGNPPGKPWQISAGPTAVTGASVRWHDAGVKPAAQISLDMLDLTASDVRWPGAQPVQVQASARVRSGKQDVAQLGLSGTAATTHASLALEARALQLAAAAPYLRAALQPELSGQVRFDAQLDWAAGDAPRLALALKDLHVEALRLHDAAAAPAPKAEGRAPRRAPPHTLAQVEAIDLDQAQVDLIGHRASLGALRVQRPALTLRRDAKGQLDAAGWVKSGQPESQPDAPAPPRSGTPWKTTLRNFVLTRGRVDWHDDAARPGRPAPLQLRELLLDVRSVSWPATATPAEVHLAAQLLPPAGEPGAPAAKRGRIDARARLVLAPLSARGTVDAERLPVHALEPYFGAALPVLLRSAELGFKGSFDFRQDKPGITLDTKGDLLLADLRVDTRTQTGPHDARSSDADTGDELLAWNALTLKPLRVRLAPGTAPRVDIGAAELNNFYARLLITEQGRFNLTGLQAPAAADAGASAPTPNPARAPEPPAQAASAAALPIELDLGGVKLVDGRVDFSDRFIRPHYSAAITALQGSVGHLATGTREMAAVDLRGRVAGTALLEIRGAFNPTAQPLALDIAARATDLELAPLSPYAGKYAGYGIERGKLSMDVAYRISEDGKLDARNQVVLNQLTFGERIDSPSATSLPVKLALALLSDRHGVIDVNLPISGSVNDPQFSIWGLVFKVIGNLLAKAVTAPFSLLTGGGGEELSLIEFVPGTTQIAPASTATMERVAGALVQRPALRMTVTGAADPVSEREAIQAASLDTRILAEQRRSLARAGTTLAADAALPPLTTEERTRLVRRLYSETALPDKPRNFIGIDKDLPLAEMEARLKAGTVVSTDTARELALQRGLAVRDALIARGLSSERLFLGAPRVRAAAEDDATWTPRVQLSLEER
jgi:uncharacterized protein involved in outer membrane biogenesis